MEAENSKRSLSFSFVDIGNMVASPFTELAHGRLPSGGLTQIAGPTEKA